MTSCLRTFMLLKKQKDQEVIEASMKQAVAADLHRIAQELEEMLHVVTEKTVPTEPLDHTYTYKLLMSFWKHELLGGPTFEDIYGDDWIDMLNDGLE